MNWNKFVTAFATASTRRDVLIATATGALAGVATNINESRAAPTGGASPTNMVLIQGENRVERDQVVDGELIVPPGARMVIDAGVTLTLRGDIVAPPTRIFWGDGKVDFTGSKVLAARPEWWGARANDASIDCRPALAACLDAHLAMMLGLGTYYIADTWTIDRPNRRIWGIGRTKDASGTRIALTRGGHGTVVRIGSERAPPTINDYLTGVDVRGIEFGRSAGAVADAEDPAIGLSVRHVLDCRFEDLRANEHAICYSIQGAVRTYFRDCRAFRSLSQGSGKDSFVGFDLDGGNPSIATGANASIYLIDCNATVGGPLALSSAVGLRLLGAMSDTFVTRFETTTLAVGILIEGGGRLGRPPSRFSQIDIHIDTPILDQCSDAGIAIAGLGATAMLEITSPYVAVSPAGTSAISLTDCGGSIRVAGGQLVGSLAKDAVGLRLERSAGTSVDGTCFLGFDQPIIAREASGFELVVSIIADSVGHGPAVVLDHCQRGYIRPRLSGRSGSHAACVAIDGSSSALSIETIGVDPAILVDREAAVVAAGHAALGPATSLIFIPSRA